MGWKDYFYFTRTERNGIIVLVILIILIILLPFIYQFFYPVKVYDFSEFDRKVDRYEQMLAEYREARTAIEASYDKETASRSSLILNLQPFDPNSLGREEFMEMGLPERIAGNIINYRNAGGSFRFKEDLKRIYSINDGLYYRLENYIDLPSREDQITREDEQRETRRFATDTTSRVTFQPRWADVLIDMNRADSTEWQQIRGIGPVFSRRITTYRDLLGGFYSTSQLMEVFGMDSTRYEQIKPHIFLSDSLELMRININSADFATLIRHPYLDRNQVNSILRMRDRHGNYNSVEEILRSELIDEAIYQRIAPYLTISD
ncbi:MAG: helix-hairpin-helix domain-containing protein [Bacteroidales bacterium]|nr:helix-hairpin-helix domain-containing protein [Bacteroidales bacterium]